MQYIGNDAKTVLVDIGLCTPDVFKNCCVFKEEKKMEKDMTLELNSEQAQDTGSGNASLLPYTAPKLFIYNQAKITMGGVNLRAQDWIGPGTSYRSS